MSEETAYLEDYGRVTFDQYKSLAMRTGKTKFTGLYYMNGWEIFETEEGCVFDVDRIGD